MSDLTFNDSFSRKLESTDLGKKFWKNNAQGKFVLNTEFLADVLKIKFHPSTAGYILFVDRDEDGTHHVRYFNTANEEQVQWMMLLGLAYLSLHYGKRNFPFLRLLSNNNKWVSNCKDIDYSSLYRLAVKFFAPIWFTQKIAEKELGDDKVTSSNLEQAWPAYWNYSNQFVLPKHVKDEGYLMLHYYYENLEYSREYVKVVLRGRQSQKASNGQLTNCEIGLLTLELASGKCCYHSVFVLNLIKATEDRWSSVFVYISSNFKPLNTLIGFPLSTFQCILLACVLEAFLRFSLISSNFKASSSLASFLFAN